MMRIVVNGRFLGQSLTGVQRFAIECTRALREEIAGRNDVSLTLQRAPRACAEGLAGYLWEQLALPVLGRGAFVVSLGNLGAVLCRRQLVVLHDAAVYDVPSSYRATYRLAHRAIHRALVRRRVALATVSEFSRERLAVALRIPARDIGVVGVGSDHLDDVNPDPTVLKKLGLRPRSYVLSVASRAPHKNIGVLEAVAPGLVEQGLQVVLVGGKGRAHVATAPTTEAIFETGRVTDPELRALYEQALAFVFPSRYEGFGIPPLEAMRLGCPVLVAETRPFTDHLADGTIAFPPHDTGFLVASLVRLQSNPSLRAALAARGRAVAGRWLWRDVARRMFVCLLSASQRDPMQQSRNAAHDFSTGGTIHAN